MEEEATMTCPSGKVVGTDSCERSRDYVFSPHLRKGRRGPERTRDLPKCVSELSA